MVIQPKKEAPLKDPPPTHPVTHISPVTPPQHLEYQHTSSASHPTSLKGKGKTPPTVHPKPKRLSINSVHSLSSVSLFHNDLLICQTLSQQGLKRVDSLGSVVLPPKVDTTEAVITMNSKGPYHPTLNAILDFPSELSHQLHPTEQYNSKPHLRASSKQSESTIHSQQAHLLPSGSKTPMTQEQSECTRQLKRFSNVNGPPHYINLKGANDSSIGLISSLLSPQITFKSRRTQTPQTHSGNGPGYFDSFKSLVGMNSLITEPTPAPDLSNQGVSPPTCSSTCANSSKGTTSTTVVGSLPKDNSISQSCRPFAHLQTLHGGSVKLTNPKPVVPGFINTCGPIPVISKFIGPRLALAYNNDSSQSPNISTDPPQGSHNEAPAKTQNQSTSNSPQHSPTKLDNNQNASPTLVKRSVTHSTGSLSRIQKKLLMERDRPISPTLYEQINHHQATGHDSNPLYVNPSRSPSLTQAGGQITSRGGSGGGTLPPPSYLIRSLGGQTGPLPFIPLNLLPASSTHQPTMSPIHLNNDHTGSNTPIIGTSLKTINNEKNNSSTTNLIKQQQPNSQKETGLTITPSTPDLNSITQQNTQQQETNWLSAASPSSSSDVVVMNGSAGRLNEPALKAKQAISIKLWRNSLIDEVEQILTDHESNTRFRNPLIESLNRTFRRHSAFCRSEGSF